MSVRAGHRWGRISGDSVAARKTLMAAILCSLVLMACTAKWHGIWLDEFWSIWFSGHDIGFAEAMRTRWLPDIHPPFYAMAIWALAPLTSDDIFVRRLTNFIPVALFLLLAAFLARRRAASPFLILLFAAIVVANPFTISAFGEYRSLTAQIMAGACLMLLMLAAVDGAEDLSPRRDPALVALIVIATFACLNIHLLATAINGAVIACACATLFAIGRRGWALAFFVSGLIGGAVALFDFLQRTGVLASAAQEFWVKTGVLESLLLVGGLFAAVLVSNPLLALSAVQHGRMAEPTEKRRLALAVGLVAAIVAVDLLFVLLNARKPFLISRYLFAELPYILGALVLLGGSAIERRPARVLLGAAIGVMIAAGCAVYQGTRKNWDETAAIVQRQVAACPASPVIGLLPAQLKDPAAPVDGEANDVFRFSYRYMGRRYGFVISDRDVLKTYRGTCPVVVWSEHAFRVPKSSTIRAIMGLDPARVTRIDRRQGQSGFVETLWLTPAGQTAGAIPSPSSTSAIQPTTRG